MPLRSSSHPAVVGTRAAIAAAISGSPLRSCAGESAGRERILLTRRAGRIFDPPPVCVFHLAGGSPGPLDLLREWPAILLSAGVLRRQLESRCGAVS